MLAENGQSDAAADQLTGMRRSGGGRDGYDRTRRPAGIRRGRRGPRTRPVDHEPCSASPRSSPTPICASALSWHGGGTQWRGTISPDCLDEHRFEYAVELSVGGSVLRASEYLGDGFDWYRLDLDSTADQEAAPPAAAYKFTDESIPSVVRYGGLPADRFWEMEDARIDLGATDVSTLDTGRLLLISFATVYGNDWFLTPLEVPVGSLTTIEQMRILDVFERNHLIKRAGTDEPSWSMYTLHSDDPDHWAAKSLLMMPCTQGHRGEPLEQISLTRDELANLAWAVQHRITDDRGEPVTAVTGGSDASAHRGGDRTAPAYRVQTHVPDYWFPLVPVQEKPGVIHFGLAEMIRRRLRRERHGQGRDLSVPISGYTRRRCPARGPPCCADRCLRAGSTDRGTAGCVGRNRGQRGKFERTGLRQRLAHRSMAVTARARGRG